MQASVVLDKKSPECRKRLDELQEQAISNLKVNMAKIQVKISEATNGNLPANVQRI